MLRYIIIILMSMASFTLNAQSKDGGLNRQFNPQKFENQLENYILRTVDFTQAEKKNFVVIFRDARKELVTTMDNDRKHKKARPTSEREWAEAVKSLDLHEIKLKKIQQAYHNKLLKVLPASKVMKAIRAEEYFHRESFKKMQIRVDNRRKQKQNN